MPGVTVPGRPYRLLAFALCAAIAAALWYPLRNAAAYMDDHVFLMVGRHLEHPWPLLVQDSIGSYFFRPVVMFFWWLSERMAGDSAAAHYGINMAVHGINAALLVALLRRHGIATGASLVAGAIFAAHPTAFSAAAWLCIRFDLLATTFGLAALIAVQAFRDTGGLRHASVATMMVALSIGSKETGFGMALVVVLALAWPGAVAAFRTRVGVAIAVSAVVAAGLLLRVLLLREVPELREPVHVLALRGALRFMSHLPEFAVVRQGNVVAIGAWIALLAAMAAAMLLPRVFRETLQRRHAPLAVIGFATFAVSVLAPAPIIAQVPIPGYAFGMFDAQALLSARFFYLPLAGLAMLVAVLGDAVSRGLVTRPARIAMVALSVAGIVGLTASSRGIGRDWAAFTQRGSGVYEAAAVAAVRPLTDLPRGCKIYLLGTPASAMHFRESADPLVKHGLPRGHPAVGCFIQAEHAPWHHFLDAHTPDAAAAPLETITVGGKPFEPLALGNLRIQYLKIPASPAVAADPMARFFSWENGRFIEATDGVRGGRIAPVFHDNRPQQ